MNHGSEEEAMFDALKKFLLVAAATFALAAASAPAALARYDTIPFGGPSPSTGTAGGFNWGDAALGAALALALVAIGVGVGVMVVLHRNRELPTSAPAR
jgi:hypothetical protein